MGRSSRRRERKSFCTWPRIFALALVLAVSSFLVYFFEPWKRIWQNDSTNKKNNIENNENENDNDNNNDKIIIDGDSGGNNGIVISGPSLDKPVVVEEPNPQPPTTDAVYQFMQCDPDNTGQSDCCNGLKGACDLRVDEIMYATLHNGMATFEDGYLFRPNHQSPLEEALEAGYRGLNLDVCNCGGEIIFCHGICGLGPRDVVEVMQNVNKFLDKNPTEVIVFIYQIDDDADRNIDLNAFYDKLLLVDGLVEKLYVHDGPDTAWPTLRRLTRPAFNKRIIMFHYNGPNCNTDPSACPDGLHLYYNYGSDNDWEHDDISSIENRYNSCTLKKNGVNSKTFVGLNNFVSPPSRSSAAKLNAYSAVTDYVNDCTQRLGADINFLLVDFWSEGDLPRATQDHNAALVRQRRRQLR